MMTSDTVLYRPSVQEALAAEEALLEAVCRGESIWRAWHGRRMTGLW